MDLEPNLLEFLLCGSDGVLRLYGWGYGPAVLSPSILGLAVRVWLSICDGAVHFEELARWELFREQEGLTSSLQCVRISLLDCGLVSDGEGQRKNYLLSCALRRGFTSQRNKTNQTNESKQPSGLAPNRSQNHSHPITKPNTIGTQNQNIKPKDKVSIDSKALFSRLASSREHARKQKELTLVGISIPPKLNITLAKPSSKSLNQGGASGSAPLAEEWVEVGAKSANVKQTKISSHGHKPYLADNGGITITYISDDSSEEIAIPVEVTILKNKNPEVIVIEDPDVASLTKSNDIQVGTPDNVQMKTAPQVENTSAEIPILQQDLDPIEQGGDQYDYEVDEEEDIDPYEDVEEIEEEEVDEPSDPIVEDPIIEIPDDFAYELPPLFQGTENP
ncbi:hypothetical protein V2J09_016529 [Rumex salicifolius]